VSDFPHVVEELVGLAARIWDLCGEDCRVDHFMLSYFPAAKRKTESFGLLFGQEERHDDAGTESKKNNDR
jgi:hypothetical protein